MVPLLGATQPPLQSISKFGINRADNIPPSQQGSGKEVNSAETNGHKVQGLTYSHFYRDVTDNSGSWWKVNAKDCPSGEDKRQNGGESFMVPSQGKSCHKFSRLHRHYSQWCVLSGIVLDRFQSLKFQVYRKLDQKAHSSIASLLISASHICMGYLPQPMIQPDSVILYVSILHIPRV